MGNPSGDSLKVEHWVTNSEAAFQYDLSDPNFKALEAFKANPHKAWQKHISEALADRPQLPPEVLKDTWVYPISNEEAAAIILRCEWLRTMPAGCKACYGLKLGNENGDLLGAVCFSEHSCSTQARNICTIPAKVVCLARGACVPHAPERAASKLIRHACRLAHEQFGWEVYFSYFDSEAGEIGTVYQSVGWKYIGKAKQGIKCTCPLG